MKSFEKKMEHLVAVIGLERAIQSAGATPWGHVESVILILRKKVWPFVVLTLTICQAFVRFGSAMSILNK